ncbi:3232_t:CDS:2 [Paraglomus brasilianum]|uniref:3232_t:CDS:1 n=1 Tax=Paraglomus brasilianum TaxID=144538 RepID=A0A9N9BUC8_9GLOM|nr:3232_t:CDS:2 [Paraglomus brasilianum]
MGKPKKLSGSAQSTLMQIQSSSMISKRKEGKLNSNSIAKKLVSMQLDAALLAPIVKMEGIGESKQDLPLPSHRIKKTKAKVGRRKSHKKLRRKVERALVNMDKTEMVVGGELLDDDDGETLFEVD